MSWPFPTGGLQARSRLAAAALQGDSTLWLGVRKFSEQGDGTETQELVETYIVGQQIITSNYNCNFFHHSFTISKHKEAPLQVFGAAVLTYTTDCPSSGLISVAQSGEGHS